MTIDYEKLVNAINDSIDRSNEAQSKIINAKLDTIRAEINLVDEKKVSKSTFNKFQLGVAVTIMALSSGSGYAGFKIIQLLKTTGVL